jgi:hypothetical protein
MMAWYVGQQSQCRSTCHLTDDKSLLDQGAAHAVVFGHTQLEKDVCGGKCLPTTHKCAPALRFASSEFRRTRGFGMTDPWEGFRVLTKQHDTS